MSDQRLSESRSPGGAHHFLSRLVGSWVGTTRTWFEPGKLADESPVRGRMRSVLDGRFVVWEYEGSLKGTSLFGMAILGHHIDANRYTMAWVDSFHMGTATMHSEGEPRGDGFSVLGAYEVPGGPAWGWRTEFTLQADDQLCITAYNVPPGGSEAKATETILRRA